MKQCPKCGGSLADFVEVCPYCGAPMPLAPCQQLAAQFQGGAPQWGGQPQSSGKALASLLCGVVFFFWPVSPIAAVILGHLALADIERSAGHLTGRGIAIGGPVTGYIGVSFIPMMIVAAIAIPNILRARMAANEASAVSTLRNYNTALVSYASECPNQGYPPALTYLGPARRPRTNAQVQIWWSQL